ncbi:MAG: hypothetical protein CMQ40_05355 [Gammaproteobacteria bacterium]|nr:hypothetical protein [Gammaproteobacteria bacterium]|tara:strand:+ start:49 stop:1014 length:966 start_codon:yes stop_codon:yes gene_type:complete
MKNILRTPDSNFEELDDFLYEPKFHQWQGCRVHYIDEGERNAPIMLLLHGMPTWGYLYRKMIPKLVEAGFRCIVPDHLGFGRSDKPTDPVFYTIARHTEILTSLITELDLKKITLVCQDWGGPIGLAQAVYMPERFSRLTIMNTWLHHPEYQYSEAIKKWNMNWQENGLFSVEEPDIAALLLISSGILGPKEAIPWIIHGKQLTIEKHAMKMYRGFKAPYKGMPSSVFNAFRAFPLSICHYDYHRGNGAAQTYFFQQLLNWSKPAHFIWGCADDIFTEDWGRAWAKKMNATFNPIKEAGHFLQNTHGETVVELLLNEISKE